jgi:hypothetical protein
MTLEALAPLLVVVLVCDIFARRLARVLMITGTCLVIGLVMRPIETERVEWGREFWEVTVPELPDPSHTMIIVANPRPWAYLVAQFPPGVRWVSLNSNLTNPGQVTRLQGKVRHLISEHEGDLFLLTRSRPSIWLQHDRQILRYYRLEVDAAGPQPLLSKHSRPGLHLYRVRRR